MSDNFLMITWALWILKRKTTEIRCHFLKSTHHQRDFTPADVGLDHPAEVVSVLSLHCEVSIRLSMLYTLKENPSV